METLGDNFTSKKHQNFECEICDFNCSKKGDWKRHTMTSKHKKMAEANDLDVFGDNFTSNYIQTNYTCEVCNKKYNSRNGIWKHKNSGKCTTICDDKNMKPIDNDLILLLIKENSELKSMMIDQQNKMMESHNKFFEQQNLVLEIAKNGTHNTTTTHTNSHNKSFNLQFFLNETCKDAMNITDFVDSLKLQLSDLERVGELGYIEGISNIIVKNLKELDITQRPVHCTDKKRETIYIKDEDKWEKDDEKKKMHKLIKRVADKNARLLPKFKEKYPDYRKSTSPLSDQYNKILIESMGGQGDNDFEKEEKIIKKVSKEIIVEK
jgi:hypothetical protein